MALVWNLTPTVASTTTLKQATHVRLRGSSAMLSEAHLNTTRIQGLPEITSRKSR